MSARTGNTHLDRQPRRAWQRPSLKNVGSVSEVVQQGGGKVTVVTGDPGEPQKVPSMES
jgi:hypothetical protein